jgi:hypothetical protein
VAAAEQAAHDHVDSTAAALRSLIGG